ncbi:MAG: outer membrane beta-barrel protein [Cyclobacteriaceae bacterium]
MIQKDFLLGNKILITGIFCLISLGVMGQKKPPKNPLESFLDTQFWLGLRMGVNYTQAFPETSYEGISPINYTADDPTKSYDDFSLSGAHMGLEMNFYHRGFSASFQPAFKRSRYSYSSGFVWEGAQVNSRFETNYKAEQRLDLIELPLMIKGDIIRKGKIRPFLMIGGFYSLITSVQKDVDVSQIDYSSGTPLESSSGTVTIGVKDAFQNFYGIAGGAGVNLDYWNIRTVFEVAYQRALSSATKPGVLQNELASLGDVNDELRLRDISVSLSFVFPFRFIDQQFKAL